MNENNQVKKILILTANPSGTSKLRLDEEVREIEAGLQRSQKRDLFVLEQKWAVRPRDIQRAMLDINPQIVHFSGHGTGEEGLVFEDEIGQAKLVSGEALAELFKLFAEQVECVVLNGCYSQVQAEAIAQHIPYVIGMSLAIGDRAAIEFAVGFYDAIGAGRSVEFAYSLGCSAIRMAGIAEHLTPVLIKKPDTMGTAVPPNPAVEMQSAKSGAISSSENQRIEVFFSYAHEDEKLRDELAKQLKLLERQGVISAWHDRQIVAGSEWGSAIDTHLDSAQVILLLISPDFLASDYCWDIEVKRAMERHEAGEARVIPVILRPVDSWQETSFGKLQALPTNAQPVTTWENRDEAFRIVAQGIRKAIADSSPTPPLSHDDLYRTLLRLGYRSQVRLFRKLIEAESVAAFLIHGLPDYGQRWLLNRLVVQYVPHFLNGKVVVVNVSRKVRKNDVSALWREVAGRVGLGGLGGKQYTPSEIAEQVIQCLQTQNVLLVFHEVETMPETTLSELIDNFWLPLVSKVQEQTSQARKYKLLMFLIDYEGCVGSWEVPFAEKLNSNWQSQIPLRPPIITEFSDNELVDWIETEYDKLPPALTAQVDNTVQAILANSDNGVPERVLETICADCGYDWYEESDKWLKL